MSASCSIAWAYTGFQAPWRQHIDHHIPKRETLDHPPRGGNIWVSLLGLLAKTNKAMFCCFVLISGQVLSTRRGGTPVAPLLSVVFGLVPIWMGMIILFRDLLFVLGKLMAHRTSRGLSSEEEQAALDAINNNPGEPLGPPPFRPRRALSSFEQQHFHPLNVTPDRPCSAFFRASEEYFSKAIINICIAIGIPAVAVKCLQRRSSGEAMIIFSTEDYCNLFLAESAFSSSRRRSTSNSASEDLEYLTIFDAPHELPDSAIEQRLKPFCQVISKRRNCVQGFPEVCNGIRTYRVRLHKSVPCYLRFEVPTCCSDQEMSSLWCRGSFSARLRQ